MSARDAILAAIRAADAPVAPRADVDAAIERATAASDAATSIEQLTARFRERLASVGGQAVIRAPGQSVAAALATLDRADRVGARTLPGRFMVAENGAVYVDAADLDERARIVTAEHLVITVPAREVVATMHDAVRRMSRAPGCGWYLSGPSKTADIEQSLVIGAQGARTLTVVLTAG